MKAAYNENREKTYEDKARELSGYDDAALLREAASAEREWQQEKVSHPERAAELEQAANLNFEILMSKLNSEGLKPVSERRYNRKQKWDNRDVTKVRKINRKVVVLAAVVALLAIGGSIGAMARSGYRYSAYPGMSKQNKLIQYNTAVEFKVETIEMAYEIIEDKIDMPVLMMNYIPKGMYFEKIVINSDFAILELTYNGKNTYLKEARNIAGNESAALVSDRKNCEEFRNVWLDTTIFVEENKLEDGSKEYSASIRTEEGLYYLSGIMEKEEFIAIIKNLMFL